MTESNPNHGEIHMSSPQQRTGNASNPEATMRHLQQERLDRDHVSNISSVMHSPNSVLFLPMEDGSYSNYEAHSGAPPLGASSLQTRFRLQPRSMKHDPIFSGASATCHEPFPESTHHEPINLKATAEQLRNLPDEVFLPRL